MPETPSIVFLPADATATGPDCIAIGRSAIAPPLPELANDPILQSFARQWREENAPRIQLGMTRERLAQLHADPFVQRELQRSLAIYEAWMQHGDRHPYLAIFLGTFGVALLLWLAAVLIFGHA